ncbi:Pycsar system effector family protein [uncultured Chryseobacterium sp.]|uniref:Pycsar system effector family protein n=1 Tax=uncultured Chryseobacterium sp. TaxID=259322 RepID=UPI00260A0B04|nr:Pycsar system effector family protein [uncultured Chryseobacterium sp.]
MTLLEKTRIFVENLFKDKLSDHYLYHNFQHTVFTVDAVSKISENENIGLERQEKLLIAAWFHDTGYTINAELHEEKSVEIMSSFLLSEGQSQAYIDEVAQLIMSTKIGYFPQNILEQIIKDADCAHFGSEQYPQISADLRKEWELTGFRTFTDVQWNQENCRVLRDMHRYYTDFAKKMLNPTKQNNIKKIEEKLEEQEKEIHKKEEKKKDKKADKELKTDRSVDTMFRVTLNNHTRLSDIADSKANILLSVNAIIISVSLTVLIPKLDAPSNAHLIFPTFLLIIFSVVTIIFVILSTRPKVTENKFSMQDVKNRKVNLLFFGNFNQMSFEEFLPSMRELLADKEYLYDTMIKDLYALGQVLDKKYKMLRVAYTIFMVGIIVSVLAFVYAFWTI